MSATAVVVDRGEGDESDAAGDGDERSGNQGRHPPQHRQHGDGGSRERHGRPADVAELVDDGVDVREEVVGGRVAGDAEQLGQLTRRDRQAHADLDPGERGLRDVYRPTSTGRSAIVA
jgi:hypothetical protein